MALFIIASFLLDLYLLANFCFVVRIYMYNTTFYRCKYHLILESPPVNSQYLQTKSALQVSCAFQWPLHVIYAVDPSFVKLSEAMARDLEMLKRVESTSFESLDFNLNLKKTLKDVRMVWAGVFLTSFLSLKVILDPNDSINFKTTTCIYIYIWYRPTRLRCSRHESCSCKEVI